MEVGTYKKAQISTLGIKLGTVFKILILTNKIFFWKW